MLDGDKYSQKLLTDELAIARDGEAQDLASTVYNGPASHHCLAVFGETNMSEAKVRSEFQSVMTKLRQGQIWKHGKEFLRIVRLERLAVEYKSTLSLTTKLGTHHQLSKKEFCRLIKTATLLQSVDETRLDPTS